MTENSEYIEIYPKVFVYRNILKDSAKMYRVLNESDVDAEGKYFLKKWTPWAHFGTYSSIKEQHEIDQALINDQRFIEEKEVADEARRAYDLVLDHYVKVNNVDLPDNWRFSGMSFSKYVDQIDTLSNNMTMQYHTDHITSQKDMPGEKFFITCTMYINDDYDGGDIEFYVDGNIVNHKPKAGDILVFPSTEPYYHGVKTIYNGQKFLVRAFIMHTFAGTKEWLDNQLKFGAYKWSKMEIERIEKEDPRNMKYLQDGVPVEYDKLRSNDSGGM
jgi:2OG-Fe(II) oxygenase superfamily